MQTIWSTEKTSM